MNKKSIIFDMDGTILDSMMAWKNLGRNYLKGIGVQPAKDLENTIASMTLYEAAEYFHEHFGVSQSPEKILEEVIQMINTDYYETIPAKKGMKELILKEKLQTSRMCILTTSDYDCADRAMKRLGIRDCFEQIFTAEQLGMSKREPEIYAKTCELMGFNPEQTIVYEDVLHAVKAAKKAGCRVIAVYDSYSESDWDKICAAADDYIR